MAHQHKAGNPRRSQYPIKKPQLKHLKRKNKSHGTPIQTRELINGKGTNLSPARFGIIENRCTFGRIIQLKCRGPLRSRIPNFYGTQKQQRKYD